MENATPAEILAECKKRDIKLKTKERDLIKLADDLDKKGKDLLALEQKHGALYTREEAVLKDQTEIENKRRAQAQKDKQLKEREEGLDLVEAKQSQREKDMEKSYADIVAGHAALDKRKEMIAAEGNAMKVEENRLAELRKGLEEEVMLLKREESRIEGLQAKLARQNEATSAFEEEQKNRKKKLDAQEDRLKKWMVELEDLKKQLEFMDDMNKKKAQDIVAMEAALRTKQLETMNEARQIAQKGEEMKDKVRELDDREKEIKVVERAALEKMQATHVQQERVDISLLEVLNREQALTRDKELMQEQQLDIQKREAHIEATWKEFQVREANIIRAEDKLRALGHMHDLRAAEIANRETDVLARAEEVKKRQEEVKKMEASCLASEQRTTEREELITTNEKALVNWMKEMEWRERMLSQREICGSPMRHPLPETTTVGEISRDEKAYRHNTFGRALLAVQLKRLKDQYISTQIRVSVRELEARTKARETFSSDIKHARDVDVREDLLDEVNLQSRTDHLHELLATAALEFARKVSTLRAFDSAEDPQSEVRLEQLQHFTHDEQMTVQLCVYLERVLKDEEHFMKDILKCPLQDRDKIASDLLLQKLNQWWCKMRTRALRRDLNVSEVRMDVLRDALQVLDTKAELLQRDKGTITEILDKSLKYKAKNSMEHVMESSILAPAGKRTLKYAKQGGKEGTARPASSMIKLAERPSTVPAKTTSLTPLAPDKDMNRKELALPQGPPSLGVLTPIRIKNLVKGYADQTFRSPTMDPPRMAQLEPRWTNGQIFEVVAPRVKPKSPYDMPLPRSSSVGGKETKRGTKDPTPPDADERNPMHNIHLHPHSSPSEGTTPSKAGVQWDVCPEAPLLDHSLSSELFD